jgi:hypothetical protein
VDSDPFIPDIDNHSSAHGIQINNIGRTSIILLACFTGLALGVSLGALFFMAAENRSLRDELRETKTETRLLEYYVNIVNQSLNENHIKMQTFLEFKQQQHKE